MSHNNDDPSISTDRDPDESLGAVAQDRPGQPDNMSSFTQQIDHRDQRSIKKGNDTDFPEPGSNPEYSMQKQQDLNKQGDPLDRPESDSTDLRAEDEMNQDPGERQKENQNKNKDDDLAA